MGADGDSDTSEACNGGQGSWMVLDEIHESDDPDESGSSYEAEQLEADGDLVYFVDGEGIHSVPRCGGTPTLRVDGAHPFNDGLVATPGALTWTTSADPEWELVSAPLAGGAGTNLATFEGYTHRLRTDGSTLVWNGSVGGFPDESRIYAIETDGTGFRTIARGRYGWSFDIDDGVVYAGGYLPETDPETSPRILFSLPAAGGEPQVLAENFGDEYPTGIVVGDDNVYYFRAWSSDHRGVERIAKGGGAREEIDLGDAPVPDHLLYSDGQLFGVVLSGEVYAIAPDGPAELIATTQAQLYEGDVLVDAGAVFVTDWSHECLETGLTPPGHGGGVEICVRSRTHRTIQAVSLGAR